MTSLKIGDRVFVVVEADYGRPALCYVYISQAEAKKQAEQLAFEEGLHFERNEWASRNKKKWVRIFRCALERYA